MKRSIAALGLAAAVALGFARTAAAELGQIGGFLGPRVFAGDARLGNNDDHPELETALTNSIVIGGRLSVPVSSWLVPEIELAMSPASTRAYNVSVFWLAPRGHVRLQWSNGRLRPFVVLGAGAPVALSSNHDVFPHGITVEGYGGGGFLWAPGRGVGLRVDARLAMTPARAAPDQSPVTVEGEISLGVWVPLGRAPARPVRPLPPPDQDGDGIVDANDRCADRAEDKDDVEDADGCPDIDDDGDLVLDVADQCVTMPESYNGFEDDDGCPDTVPTELATLVGPLESQIFSEGNVNNARMSDGKDSAELDALAATLRKYPSVRVIVTGHTDDREATPIAAEASDALVDTSDDSVADPAASAAALGLARAAAVRDALVTRGIVRRRIDVATAGAESPRADNATRVGRLRNRRVAIALFTPKR